MNFKHFIIMENNFTELEEEIKAMSELLSDLSQTVALTQEQRGKMEHVKNITYFMNYVIESSKKLGVRS